MRFAKTTADEDASKKDDKKKDDDNDEEKLQHSVTLGSLYKSFKDYKWGQTELTPE